MDSIWSKTCKIPERPSLEGDLRCEIAVIGAGITGILTAYLLTRAGHNVVVLEANRIASGQTRNTTAKITAQHGLTYARLTEQLGTEQARLYAAANQDAVEAYRALVNEQSIDCAFQDCDAFVYAQKPEPLQREAKAAAALGLPADFLAQPNGPIACGGAVRFRGQAQFHPLRFVRHLAEKLMIFEQTPVRGVEGGLVRTDHGVVAAERVVFACHYPFLRLPGLYFMRLHQERSYVIALEHADGSDGMWLGADGDKLSFRRYGPYVLLGGGGHRTGENCAGGQYQMLRTWAQRLFPEATEAAHWSAQDCVSPDGIPLIGTYSPWRKNWYLATGFRKWGMTSAMVAARLVCAEIEGNPHPASAVFSPGRFRAGVLAGAVAEGPHAVKGIGRQLFFRPACSADRLSPGHGGVVQLQGAKAGVCKAQNGAMQAVKTRCPHLGCQLEWNPEEQSWDCPCHGSRFAADGGLISGPAQTGLTTIAPDESRTDP